MNGIQDAHGAGRKDWPMEVLKTAAVEVVKKLVPGPLTCACPESGMNRHLRVGNATRRGADLLGTRYSYRVSRLKVSAASGMVAEHRGVAH